MIRIMPGRHNFFGTWIAALAVSLDTFIDYHSQGCEGDTVDELRDICFRLMQLADTVTRENGGPKEER